MERDGERAKGALKPPDCAAFIADVPRDCPGELKFCCCWWCWCRRWLVLYAKGERCSVCVCALLGVSSAVTVKYSLAATRTRGSERPESSVCSANFNNKFLPRVRSLRLAAALVKVECVFIIRPQGPIHFDKWYLLATHFWPLLMPFEWLNDFVEFEALHTKWF